MSHNNKIITSHPKLIFISFLIFLTSLFVERSGGLYINSYWEKGDLIRISELQGTGDSDFIMIVISSFILFFSILTTSLTKVLDSIKILLYMIYLLISIILLNFTETANFIDINYATLFLAKNPLYITWFVLYIAIYVLVAYELFKLFINRKVT